MFSDKVNHAFEYMLEQLQLGDKVPAAASTGCLVPLQSPHEAEHQLQAMSLFMDKGSCVHMPLWG